MIRMIVKIIEGLLNIPAKVYDRVIVKRIRRKNEGRSNQEQCGGMIGRGCISQIFSVRRQVVEEFLEKKIQLLYLTFTDLERKCTI